MTKFQRFLVLFGIFGAIGLIFCFCFNGPKINRDGLKVSTLTVPSEETSSSKEELIDSTESNEPTVAKPISLPAITALTPERFTNLLQKDATILVDSSIDRNVLRACDEEMKITFYTGATVDENQVWHPTYQEGTIKDFRNSSMDNMNTDFFTAIWKNIVSKEEGTYYIVTPGTNNTQISHMEKNEVKCNLVVYLYREYSQEWVSSLVTLYPNAKITFYKVIWDEETSPEEGSTTNQEEVTVGEPIVQKSESKPNKVESSTGKGNTTSSKEEKKEEGKMADIPNTTPLPETIQLTPEEFQQKIKSGSTIIVDGSVDVNALRASEEEDIFLYSDSQKKSDVLHPIVDFTTVKDFRSGKFSIGNTDLLGSVISNMITTHSGPYYVISPGTNINQVSSLVKNEGHFNITFYLYREYSEDWLRSIVAAFPNANIKCYILIWEAE